MNDANLTANSQHAAYQRERDYSRRLEGLLSRAAIILASNADRLERRGVDVAHLRNFVREMSA